MYSHYTNILFFSKTTPSNYRPFIHEIVWKMKRDTCFVTIILRMEIIKDIANKIFLYFQQLTTNLVIMGF